MEPQKAADVNACAGGQHEEDEPAVLETGMVRAGQLGELAGGMVEADGAENQTGKRADQHHGKISHMTGSVLRIPVTLVWGWSQERWKRSVET